MRMNVYWYCLLSKAIGVAGFAALVINDRPWWGLVCFLIIAVLADDEKQAATS